MNMSNINPSPVAGSIDNTAAPIHPALLDSNGSVANLGASHPVGLPAVNGVQTKSFAIGSLEHAAAVMNAQGAVTTVI
jgi:hypothetical protein